MIKAGDTATVLKKVDQETAEIVYSSGQAKGFSQNIHLKVDDTLDADLISKKILSNL
ncbi:MAG: hypothetical protein PHX70_02710 [Clostridium sp.]|nr:hypothetical protein [Clostridium sp.]